MARKAAEYHIPTVYSLNLGDRGRLVLPSALRRQLQWKPGERLVVTLQADGSLRLIDARRLVRETRGMYRHIAPGRSLANELIAERRKESAREAAEDQGHGKQKRP